MNDSLSEQQTKAVVLVSCSDDQVAFAEADPEGEQTAALLERVRTKLTIVRGFSQLLRRRLRRLDPDSDIHELDRIGEAVSELDELLYRFERGPQR